MKPQLKSVLAFVIFLVSLGICPFVIPVYWTMIITEIMIMGLLAMSFNLLFGYTGLLSFGQASFFGVGAYAMALFLSYGGQSLILGLGAALGAILIPVVIFFPEGILGSLIHLIRKKTGGKS